VVDLDSSRPLENIPIRFLLAGQALYTTHTETDGSFRIITEPGSSTDCIVTSSFGMMRSSVDVEGVAIIGSLSDEFRDQHEPLNFETREPLNFKGRVIDVSEQYKSQTSRQFAQLIEISPQPLSCSADARASSPLLQ
jgi:hypothetical protein